MEYIYAAMLLHKAGKQLNEAGIKKVLEAAGVHPEETRIKALVAALEGVDINKAIAEAAIPVATAPAKIEAKPLFWSSLWPAESQFHAPVQKLTYSWCL